MYRLKVSGLKSYFNKKSTKSFFQRFNQDRTKYKKAYKTFYFWYKLDTRSLLSHSLFISNSNKTVTDKTS